MAITLGEAILYLRGDGKDLDKSLRDADKKARGVLGGLSDFVNKGFSGLKKTVGIGLVAGIAVAVVSFVKMAREINESIDAASDLSESVNKTGVVFGQSAKEVLAWSNTTADALGQSKRQALEAAGTFGNLFTSLGLTRKEAAGMSVGLVNLASDLASFNNIDPAIVLEKLRAGIVGETEPLRALGVNLSAVAVEAKAMEMGLATSTKALTEQDKVMARYALILQMTSNAQGDFARTADGAANAQRRVDAQLDNYRTMAGKVFLPFREQTLGILADVLQRMGPYAENIMNQFAFGLARGLVAITPVLVQLKNLFAFWLKPGSPPRLLPDLIRWGIGAANAYLQGWTQADFGIFSALGSAVRSALTGLVATGAMPEGGLFGAILGSRSALATAVAEFAATGRVSEQTFASIRSSAGGAGESIEALARAYFALKSSTENVLRAQSELTAVQERYNKALEPISGEMDEIAKLRQEITDRQRLAALQKTIHSQDATADEKALAKLEMREIELRRQQSAIEDERDTAVDAAQDKLTAAQAAEEQAQIALDLQKESIAQQQEYNSLLSERMNFERQMAAEARQAANAISAAQEQAQRQAEQLTDAQLAYRLAVADTPGQIAIMRDELAKYNPAQVEYWQTLTKIQSLEETLAKQRAGAGAGIGLLPEIPALELPDLGGFGEAGEGVTALNDAIRGLMETLGLLPKNTSDNLDEMAGYVTHFGAETVAETETWGSEWVGVLKAAQALATKDWETFWTEIDRIYYRSSNGLYTTAETVIHEFMLMMAENHGDLKKSLWQIWEKIAEDRATQREAERKALAKFLDDSALALYNGGKEWISEMWRGFEEGWNNFKIWIGGLTMPWADWELPSWLQRNSPSEMEQSLMGVAGALREIQGLGGGLRALGAGAGSGDVYNVTISQSFSGNADPASVGRAARSGVGTALEMQQRRGQ